MRLSLPPELKEQLDAAWRESVERLAQEWFGSWRDAAEQAFAEQLAKLATDQEQAAEKGAQQARREFSEWLNQTVRRLRGAASHGAWLHVLLEAACRFSRFAALFSTLNNRLRCEQARNLEGAPPEGLVGLDIPLSAAPAFGHAVESGDPVVILPAAKELSESLAAALTPGASGRAHLFPLITSGSVVAVLYAEPATPEAAAALELLASIGGATLERRMAAPGPLVSIASPPPAKPQDWTELPKEERQLHIQAQRFAKWKASEIRLTQGDLVREARRKGDLYSPLRAEIEAARNEYERRFMKLSPHMVDYLHLELVRTLANDDGALLGPAYPGPLA